MAKKKFVPVPIATGSVPFPNQWRERIPANPDRKAASMTKVEIVTMHLVSALVSRHGTISDKGLANTKKLARKILS